MITSVCRDDLEDQGAGHFASCISTVKKENPSAIVEVLIPDFGNDMKLLGKVVDARPDVIGHNTRDRRAPLANDEGQKGKL